MVSVLISIDRDAVEINIISTPNTLQVIGILMGVTFLNTKNDQKVVQNKPGAIFNLIVYFTFSSIMVQTNVSKIIWCGIA